MDANWFYVSFGLTPRAIHESSFKPQSSNRNPPRKPEAESQNSEMGSTPSLSHDVKVDFKKSISKDVKENIRVLKTFLILWK